MAEIMIKHVLPFFLIIGGYCSAQTSLTINPIDTFAVSKFVSKIKDVSPSISVYEPSSLSSEQYDLRLFIIVSLRKNHNYLFVKDNDIAPSFLGILMLDPIELNIKRLIKSEDLNYHATNKPNASYASYLYFNLNQFCNGQITFLNDLEDFLIRRGEFFRAYVHSHQESDFIKNQIDTLFKVDQNTFHKKWNTLKQFIYKPSLSSSKYEDILFNCLFDYYDSLINLSEVKKGAIGFETLNDLFKNKLIGKCEPSFSLEFKSISEEPLSSDSYNIFVAISRGKISNSMYGKKYRYNYACSHKSYDKKIIEEFDYDVTQILLLDKKTISANKIKSYSINSHSRLRNKRTSLLNFDLILLLNHVGSKEKIFYSWEIFE